MIFLMKNPSLAGLASALGLVVLALATGCEPSKAAPTSASPPVANVQTVRARSGEIVRQLTLPGNIRAWQEAMLYAKVAGYLKTMAVDQGDWVKTDALLAEIEAPEMLADLDKLRAELVRHQAEVERRRAEGELARLEHERLRGAQAKSSDLVMPLSVDKARAQRDVAQATLNVALAQQNEAAASLKRVETLLAYARITAPFDGVITRRWVDPGAFIPAATSGSAAKNAAVVSLMDFRRVRVTFALPDTEVPLLTTNLAARVTVPQLPGRVFDGKVTRFAYALDEATKTMPVEIEIPNADLALRPGMYASVRITLERRANGLLVPAEALVSEKKKTHVFVVRDSKAVRVPVRVGFDDGVQVEILEGLAADEPVIVAGKQSLTDGQPVKGVEAP